MRTVVFWAGMVMVGAAALLLLFCNLVGNAWFH
jgi:hypothetical protein